MTEHATEEHRRRAVAIVQSIGKTQIESRWFTADASVWTPGGTMSAQEYVEVAGSVRHIFTTPLRMQVLHSAADGQLVMIRAASSGVLNDGVEYTNNYVFTAQFNADGLIHAFEEFFDTARAHATIIPALMRWRAEQSGTPN